MSGKPETKNRNGFANLRTMAAMKEPAQLRRLRVLILIPGLTIGGTEMDLVRTLPLLDKNRFEVVVGVLEELGVLADTLRGEGIQVVGPFFPPPAIAWALDLALRAVDGLARLAHRIAPRWRGPGRLRLALKYLRTGRSIARFVLEDRFDIIHTTSPSAFLVAALANTGSTRRALLMSRVSLAYYQRDSRWFAAIEHLLHRRIDIATGNSQATLRELRSEGIPDYKLRLLRNGIDLASFTRSMISKTEARDRLALPKDALVWTSVANYYPYKGHADLIEALHLLKDRLPCDWRLLAAGCDVVGSLGGLRLLARQRGLEGNILFLEERRDIPIILSAADIHVSASHHEGFPNNILEAMCAALPVVATAVGGVVEQINDGITGLLVPPKEPGALAAALYALSWNAERRANMGNAGRERVAAEFTIDRSVEALEGAYVRCHEVGQARISARCNGATAV